MKVLQLGLEWFPERAGGLPRYYFDLVHAAPQLFDVSGLVLGSSKVADDTNGVVRAFAPTNASLPRKFWNLRGAVRQELQQSKVDVVASHFAMFALPAIDLMKQPHVVHFHGPWAAESDVEGQTDLRWRIKRAVEQTVYRRADVFIVLSRAFSQVLQESYGVPEKRIRVIPGGVDFARFDILATQQEAREQLGWPADRPILLAVRRLVRRMGLENLVEAMTEITAHHPDTLLLLAGKGPLSQTLQAQIDARGLRNNVRLLGFLPDINLPLAYRAANFSVVPTQALEGFGLIALESLAAGTPAIVSPVGGLPEVVEPLSPSLMLSGTEARQIAERVVELLSKGAAPSQQDCRGYAARFDWPVIARRIAKVYEEVL